jgi:hypothetical protein
MPSRLAPDCTGAELVSPINPTGRERHYHIEADCPPVELQKLDTIYHLLGRKNLGDQHRASDEQPDGRIGRREQDACVRHSRAVQPEMIGIGCDQDSPVRFCKREQCGI